MGEAKGGRKCRSPAACHVLKTFANAPAPDSIFQELEETRIFYMHHCNLRGSKGQACCRERLACGLVRPLWSYTLIPASFQVLPPFLDTESPK